MFYVSTWNTYILLCSCSQDPLFFKWRQMGKLSKIDILSTQSLLRIWTYWVLNDSSEKVQLLSTQFELRIWTYWVLRVPGASFFLISILICLKFLLILIKQVHFYFLSIILKKYTIWPKKSEICAYLRGKMDFSLNIVSFSQYIRS